MCLKDIETTKSEEKGTHIGFYIQIKPVNYLPELFMNIWSSHQAVMGFDYDAEEQITMCWREKVVCTLCN